MGAGMSTSHMGLAANDGCTSNYVAPTTTAAPGTLGNPFGTQGPRV